MWDRVAGTVEARRDARTVAVTSGGTIPDRGLFPVFLADDAAESEGSARARSRGGGRRSASWTRRWSYEARAGEVVLLGASAWRIESIEHDRVLVTPAPGESGKVPFWKGDGVGRPVELGQALGAFTREISEQAGRRGGRQQAITRLREEHDLDQLAAENVLAYLDEEREVTGALPTDTTVVLQRFRDELGDWRVCLLTPFGARVHAPWALAIEARLQASLGVDVKPLWSDDGIVLRLPSTDGTYEPGEGASSLTEQAENAVLIAADDIEELVTETVGGLGPVLQPLPRERRSRAAVACAADRVSGRRCGRCASARHSCCRWPAATARSPSSSRPIARCSATSSTCRLYAASWPRSSDERSGS